MPHCTTPKHPRKRDVVLTEAGGACRLAASPQAPTSPRWCGMADSLIRGGLLASGHSITRADLLISGGKVREVGPGPLGGWGRPGHRRYGEVRPAGRHRLPRPPDLRGQDGHVLHLRGVRGRDDHRRVHRLRDAPPRAVRERVGGPLVQPRHRKGVRGVRGAGVVHRLRRARPHHHAGPGHAEAGGARAHPHGGHLLQDVHDLEPVGFGHAPQPHGHTRRGWSWR